MGFNSQFSDKMEHSVVQQKLYSQPVPNLQLVEQKPESIFDELNNSHIGVIQRAVLHMKVRAQQCPRERRYL